MAFIFFIFNLFTTPFQTVALYNTLQNTSSSKYIILRGNSFCAFFILIMENLRQKTAKKQRQPFSYKQKCEKGYYGRLQNKFIFSIKEKHTFQGRDAKNGKHFLIEILIESRIRTKAGRTVRLMTFLAFEFFYSITFSIERLQ